MDTETRICFSSITLCIKCRTYHSLLPTQKPIQPTTSLRYDLPGNKTWKSHGVSIDSKVCVQMASDRRPLSFTPLCAPTEHLQHCTFGGSSNASRNWLAADRVFQHTLPCAITYQTEKRMMSGEGTISRALIPPRASASCGGVQPCVASCISYSIAVASPSDRRPFRQHAGPVPPRQPNFRDLTAKWSKWRRAYVAILVQRLAQLAG